MRLFFAVDFSPAVKAGIAEALAGIHVKNPPWRWVSPQNLHLTLKFLGDMNDDDVPALSECAAAVATESTPFAISLGALGGFPNLRGPRVLFYRMETGSAPLKDLARRLDDELSTRMGIAREKRPFKAHATVARIKTRLPEGIVRKLEAAAPLVDVAQEVDSMLLMRSDLSPQGARYQSLKAFALSKSK